MAPILLYGFTGVTTKMHTTVLQTLVIGIVAGILGVGFTFAACIVDRKQSRQSKAGEVCSYLALLCYSTFAAIGLCFTLGTLY